MCGPGLALGFELWQQAAPAEQAPLQIDRAGHQLDTAVVIKSLPWQGQIHSRQQRLHATLPAQVCKTLCCAWQLHPVKVLRWPAPKGLPSAWPGLAPLKRSKLALEVSIPHSSRAKNETQGMLQSQRS